MRKVRIALLGLLALSAAALWLTGYIMAKDGARAESPRPVSQLSYKAVTAGREAGELVVFAPDTPPSAVTLPKYEDFDGAWPNDWQRVAIGHDAVWGKNFCVPWPNTHDAYSAAWDGWPARDGPEGYPSHTDEICSHNAFAGYPTHFESYLIYGPFTTVGATAGQIQFRVMMDTDDPFAVIAQTGSTDCADLPGDYAGSVYYYPPSHLWRAFYVDFGDFPYVGSILDEANVCLALGFLNTDNTSVNSGMFLDDISIWAAGLPTPTPTPTAFGWGDLDCNTSENVRDGQWLLTALLGSPISQTEPCPDLGEPFGAYTWGDLDCNTLVNVRDGQWLLTALLGSPISQTEPCPDLGVVP